MKTPPTCEIKVAVIGPVSAGKSTLINAILVGKYSEMSIRRTTAGVNFFRLNPLRETNTAEQEDKTTTGDGVEWSMTPDKSDSEDSVLKEITKDNKTLREVDGVCEKTFEIEGIQLCECRKDTKVVIVDIPGLNEAESSSKYREYIANKWNQFDCVILVMDARHGVNTEEQVGLLEFVKKNLAEEKDVPVIILFNKVDELDIQEEEEITNEARLKISSMFNIPGSSDIAKSIADADGQDGGEAFNLISRGGKLLPVFVPISARDGYVYRLAPVVDQARFMYLEKDLVEALGKDQIGLRQWKKLSNEQKYVAAYEAISDPAVYKDGISASNFDTFLTVLEYCIGGKGTQHVLIAKQIEVALGCSLLSEGGLAVKVTDLYERLEALESSFKSLKDAFWTKYKILEDEHLSHGHNDDLAVPLQELVRYHQLATKAQWKEEQDQAIVRAKSYLNRFADLALRRKKVGEIWWSFGISQILAMSANPQFLQHFSLLKTILEFEYHSAIAQQSQNKVGKLNAQLQARNNKPFGSAPVAFGSSLNTFGNSTGTPLTMGKLHAQNQARNNSPFGSCSFGNSTVTPPVPAHSSFSGAPTTNSKPGFAAGFGREEPTNSSPSQFQLKDGSWEIVTTGQTLVDIPPSDPRHVGHLFWIFCQWMEFLEKDSNSGGGFSFLHQSSKYSVKNANVVGHFFFQAGKAEVGKDPNNVKAPTPPAFTFCFA